MTTAKAKPKAKARRAGGPAALALLAGCFLASSLLRLGDNAAAFAQEVEPIARDLSQPQLAEAAVETDPPLTPPLQACAPDPGTDALLAAIREREAQLDTRAEELADRAQTVRVAEARLREQMAAIETMEARLAETLALAEDAAENDIGQLVAVYEAMKPKDAAEIFSSMDLQFAAGFLARMRSDRAAPILSELNAEQAYAISVIMAGRHADVPTQ
ncbi:MAG: hypothetical protein AAGE18_02440 [Pseudomonadota bacterium]